MWDLPRPGIKLRSLALAGGFLTTELLGSPAFWFWTRLYKLCSWPCLLLLEQDWGSFRGLLRSSRQLGLRSFDGHIETRLCARLWMVPSGWKMEVTDPSKKLQSWAQLPVLSNWPPTLRNPKPLVKFKNTNAKRASCQCLKPWALAGISLAEEVEREW